MDNKAVAKENRMGTMAVPELIIKTSIPLMLSMLANSLYNVVDSIFVSHVSEEALTAISLASPIQILMVSLGCGLAVGLNAVISKALGEKKREEVKQTASAAIFMSWCAYAINIVACLLIVRPFFRWQSGGNQVIEEYGIAYLSICMLFSLGQMTQWVFDRFLIGTGKSSLFLVTLSTASIVNLILDPIFIFGYLGFPAMGTAGAAIATVVGQTAGAVAGIIVNIRYNKEIPIHFTLHIQFRCVKNILKVGIPTAIMQGIMSFMGIFINTMLYQFSSTAVAVYGICLKIQSLALIGVNGINNGLIPIIAYNYGARKKKRIEESIHCALLYAGIIMLVVLLVLELLPVQILLLFDASERMLSIGVIAIRLISVSFFASVISVVFGAVFQAFGLGNYSMYLTFSRQIILLIPCIFLSARLHNLNMVWMSFAIAEILSIPIALFLYRKVKKSILKPMV